MKTLTWSGIVVRFVIAFGLVTLTWNPTEYNYILWATNNYRELAPFVMFSGLVLTIVWVVFVRAGARSLGIIGSILAMALAGSFFWILLRIGLLDRNNMTAVTWVGLTLFAAILTAGMSWSHLRRRWSGQLDIDDVDNG